jgi:hypothetical protein
MRVLSVFPKAVETLFGSRLLRSRAFIRRAVSCCFTVLSGLFRAASARFSIASLRRTEFGVEVGVEFGVVVSEGDIVKSLCLRFGQIAMAKFAINDRNNRELITNRSHTLPR